MKRHLLLIGGILWTAFIFSQSLLPASLSGSQSGILVNFIHPILINIGFNITKSNVSFIIRKLAHFTEFFVLGCLWYFILLKKFKTSLHAAIHFSFGLVVAILDEAIQTFVKGRSGEVRDVFIDFLGFLTAYMVCLVVVLFITKRKAHKQLKEEDEAS